MSFLTPAQKTALRSTKAPARTDRLDVWRSAAVSAGKVGALALLAPGVACRVWAAGSKRASSGRVDLAPAGLDGARISHYVIFDDATTDVRRGDELRDVDSRRYKVSDMQMWTTTRVVLVEEVKPT